MNDKAQSLPILQSDTPVGQDSSVWYEKGLRFQCTGCGKCCTGFPGNVWVSDKEIQAIADYLNEPVAEVRSKYTRRSLGDHRRSLKEVGKEFDCIFLENKKWCRVYEARPRQCTLYPWWACVVESPESWEEAKKTCEGIDHPDAPLISKEEIRRGVEKDLEAEL